MKRISNMSGPERDSLIRSLEIISRVATVEANRLRREISKMNDQLEAEEQKISDAEQSIVLLRRF